MLVDFALLLLLAAGGRSQCAPFSVVSPLSTSGWEFQYDELKSALPHQPAIVRVRTEVDHCDVDPDNDGTVDDEAACRVKCPSGYEGDPLDAALLMDIHCSGTTWELYNGRPFDGIASCRVCGDRSVRDSTTGNSSCLLCANGGTTPEFGLFQTADNASLTHVHQSQCICGPAFTLDEGTCVPCPRGAISTLAIPSCQWCPDNTLSVGGHRCGPCPDHAICERGAPEPRGMAGYVRDIKGGGRYVPCINKHTCPEGGETCPVGYEGRYCNLCQDGYYWWSNACFVCPTNFIARTIATGVAMMFGLSFLIFVMIGHSTKISFSSFAIAMNFLQTTSVFAGIDMGWPPVLLAVLDSLSIANFDIELLALDCQFPGKLTYMTKLIGYLAAPLVLALFVGLLIAIDQGCMAIKANRNSGAKYSENQQGESHAPRLINILGILCNVIYVSVAVKSLEIFNCQGETEKLVVSSPHLSCDSAEWDAASLVAWGGVGVYVAGIPLAYAITLGVLRPFMKRQYGGNSVFNEFFGFLVLHYKADLTTWELVILARRMIVVSSVVLIGDHFIRNLLLMGLFFVAMLLQFFFFPYTRRRHNILEGFCLLTQYLVAFGGLLFSLQRTRANSTVVLTVTIALVAFLAVCGLIIVANLCLELHNLFLLRRYSKVLSSKQNAPLLEEAAIVFNEAGYERFLRYFVTLREEETEALKQSMDHLIDTVASSTPQPDVFLEDVEPAFEMWSRAHEDNDKIRMRALVAAVRVNNKELVSSTYFEQVELGGIQAVEPSSYEEYTGEFSDGNLQSTKTLSHQASAKTVSVQDVDAKLLNGVN